MCIFRYWEKNGEEYLRVSFERPKEYGFDTVVFELPSCNVVLKQGKYTDEEIQEFKTVVKRGTDLFFKYARQGGLKL